MHLAIAVPLPLELFENICNYHSSSRRFFLLEVKQNAETEIKYQYHGYIRALISLVIK